MQSMRYFKAALATQLPPKQAYHRDFLAIHEAEFENAPNIFYDIEPELHYGQRDYAPLLGRVDSIVALTTTGRNEMDDFKAFIFMPNAQKMQQGQLFKWMESFWLATNVNNLGSMANGCNVRRCNTMLRWIDEFGKVVEEPCVMSYDLQQSNDYSGTTLNTVSGFTRAFVQKNDRTMRLVPNMRFIFGPKYNRRTYRITANGVRNYLNSVTEDEESPGIIELWIYGSYSNDALDDLERGIADAFIKDYKMKIDQDIVMQRVGYQTTLTTSVWKNGNLVTVPIRWESLDENICTIDQDGNIEIVGIGETSVRATMQDNPEVYDEIRILGSETLSEDLTISISPSIKSIYEGESTQFYCHAYKQNEQTDLQFSFSVVGNGVPQSNYKFTPIDGNSFSIKNIKMHLKEPLIIRCINGGYQLDYSILLKGAY